jgi:hypothetical protein
MSGAKTYLTCLQTDRGMSWEASQKMMADFRQSNCQFEDRDTSEVRETSAGLHLYAECASPCLGAR